jgi:two-component system response regulator FixJ
MGEDAFYHVYLNRDRLVHIVDADPATCEALSVLFRLEGFQTMFSVDIATLFVALDRRWPDIVVLNLKVGAEDGLQVLRRIKARRASTPVFMLGDRPQVEAAVQAMKAGASDVVTKPIDTEYLVTSVRDVLGAEGHPAHRGDRRTIDVRGLRS